MGVQGLWQIIDSVGHPVKLDGLEGKRLAVDANIWMYKFLLGFRNGSNLDAHKLGFYNRVLKLIFYKIRPIFVFDGPAPALKRRTLEKRQNLRAKQQTRNQDLAAKALARHLKRQFPGLSIEQLQLKLPRLESNKLVAAGRFADDDEISLITKPPPANNGVSRSDTLGEEPPDEDLPTAIRYEKLINMKMPAREEYYADEDAESFSKKQFERLRMRRSVREQIERCEREMSAMEPGMMRVQSDANTVMHYVKTSDFQPTSSTDAETKPTTVEQRVDDKRENTTHEEKPPVCFEIEDSDDEYVPDPADEKRTPSPTDSPLQVVYQKLSIPTKPETSPELVTESAKSRSSSSSSSSSDDNKEDSAQSEDESEKPEEEFEEVRESDYIIPNLTAPDTTNDTEIDSTTVPQNISDASGTSSSVAATSNPKEPTVISCEDSDDEPELILPGEMTRNDLNREASQPSQQVNLYDDDDSQARRLRNELMSETSNEAVRRGLTVTSKVTTKLIDEAKELLRLFGIPYMDAAGEAEAQCALLEQMGMTEGTITDDSDIWLFGAKNVYRNFFSDDKYVLHYKMSEIEYHLNLKREQMVCFAMMVGSDYTSGVPNLGPVHAIEVLSEFPGESLEPLVKFKSWLEKFKTKDPQFVPGKKVREKLLRFELPEGFPSEQIYEGYMNPVADHSTETFTWGTPELDELREYARRHFGWDIKKIDEKVIPVLKRRNERNFQTKIDTFFFKRTVERNPEMFRSKRINQALNRISHKSSQEQVGDEVDLSDSD